MPNITTFNLQAPYIYLPVLVTTADGIETGFGGEMWGIRFDKKLSLTKTQRHRDEH